MKKNYLLILTFLSALCGQAQINAVTETGEKVLLYENNTWKYASEKVASSADITTNPKSFTRSSNSTFLVKSKKLNIGIWIDPKLWSFEKGQDEDAAELKFEKKKEDLYAMLIAEKTEIPILNLKEIALQNAKSAAPDIRVVSEEYRNVNGEKVYMMQMAGTIQGIKFTYYGYYFSNPNGTIQLLTYTATNLFESYKHDIEDFLNGFVVTE